MTAFTQAGVLPSNVICYSCFWAPAILGLTSPHNNTNYMTITGVQHITNSPRHPSVTKRGYQHLPNIAAARIPHQMAHKWVLIRHSKSWWWLWDFIFFTLAARPLFSLGSVATAAWEVFRLGLVAVAIPFCFGCSTSVAFFNVATAAWEVFRVALAIPFLFGCSPSAVCFSVTTAT